MLRFIDRFAAWMDRYYATARITLDGATVAGCTFGLFTLR